MTHDHTRKLEYASKSPLTTCESFSDLRVWASFLRFLSKDVVNFGLCTNSGRMRAPSYCYFTLNIFAEYLGLSFFQSNRETK